MLEFIKKNKNIILSSSIFTGINTNIYCGCKDISGKGDKNKKPTDTTSTTSNNNNNTETPNVDPLKNKRDALKKLLKKINVENNKLKDGCQEIITIDDDFIDTKNKEEELKKIEENLNKILTTINNKLKDKANLKENPEKHEDPPIDKEFEKEKTELIEKVNNLEEYFKKFIFDENNFLKNFKNKLNSVKKENIDKIKELFETKDKELKDII